MMTKVIIKTILKLIFYKNYLKPATDPKICTIQPNILVRVGLNYECWIVPIFVIIGGFALFLKEMGFNLMLCLGTNFQFKTKTITHLRVTKSHEALDRTLINF